MAVAFFLVKRKEKHIITTAIEHPAVLRTMEYLETLGFEVTYLPVNENGQISMDQFKKSLREETILVSMMYGNNEVEIDYRLLKLVQFLKKSFGDFSYRCRPSLWK